MRPFKEVAKDWEKTFAERLMLGYYGIEDIVPLLEECLEEKSTKKYDDWLKKKQKEFGPQPDGSYVFT